MTTIFGASSSNVMQEGDLVIFYFSPKEQTSLTLNRGSFYQHRLGRFSHDACIGQAFGSRITAVSSRNENTLSNDNDAVVKRVRAGSSAFVYVLKPTVSLWTGVLPHRTQIIYAPDQAMIIHRLGLRPGRIVIECGTGSGALTHALAQAVTPSGHVFTFDFHEHRIECIREQFREHGLLDTLVTVTQRDVCKNGFLITTNDTFDLIEHYLKKDSVDAVFLDLPSPWDALAHAVLAMRKGACSRIVCYLPCIEQVQKTVSKMHELNNLSAEPMGECFFGDIRVECCLMREMQVHMLVKDMENVNAYGSMLGTSIVQETRGHTAFLVSALLWPK